MMDKVEKYYVVLDQMLNTTIVGDYNMSIVAKWFHAIPHLDIKLQQLKNTTFDPNDNEYLESLGILVALPGFWLILTLLFFLIFFLCRCCDANSKKKKKLTCCKCCLFHFALISCATIAIGVIGHWLSHNGVIKVQNATKDIADVVGDLKSNSHSIVNSLDNVEREVGEITDQIRSPLVKDPSVSRRLEDELSIVASNLTKVKKRMTDINTKVEKMNFQDVPKKIGQFEQIRWAANFGLMGSLTFVCLILIWGICRHSRCVLILFSVLGLLSLVICWVMTSVYFGIAIAGSDYCVDPKPLIQKQASGIAEGNIVNYYLDCDDDDQKNPFKKLIEAGYNGLRSINRSMEMIEKICSTKCEPVKTNVDRIKKDLNYMTNTVDTIFDLVECDRVHQDFLDTLSATCKDILEGVALMLISVVSAGLCFTLLVLCASHTWINIRKKRPTILEPTEETDPFLPPTSATSTCSSANSKRMRDPYGTGSSGRPRFSHTPPQTPHFPPPTSTPPSALNGRSINRDDQLSFLSPPPAYEQVGPLLHGHGQHGHHQHQHQHHQSVGPHYVADTDLMMRTQFQATKF